MPGKTETRKSATRTNLRQKREKPAHGSRSARRCRSPRNHDAEAAPASLATHSGSESRRRPEPLHCRGGRQHKLPRSPAPRLAPSSELPNPGRRPSAPLRSRWPASLPPCPVPAPLFPRSAWLGSGPGQFATSTSRKSYPFCSSLRLQRRQPHLRFSAVLVQLQRSLILHSRSGHIPARFKRHCEPIVVVPNLRIHGHRLQQVGLRLPVTSILQKCAP